MPFFASKSNIKGQPRSLNLDFLSKNVSNYETNAVLPKTVKGISSCQQNLIKTFQIEAMIALITKTVLIFFMRLVKWPKIAVTKCQNLIFKVNFQGQKSSKSL